MIFKGNFLYTPALGELTVREGEYLVVDGEKCAGFYRALPQEYAGQSVTDFGRALVLPAFCDLHLHAPQMVNRGVGYDQELLPWLETYTFPVEARYGDADFAEAAWKRFLNRMWANGTLRFSAFATIHKEAAWRLMELTEQAGLSALIGKVNMDRNAAPGVLEETTEESIRETERWLGECSRFSHVRPMLTPRFTPSCTDELMAWLGKTAEERHLPIQSHLSENDREIEWVRQLHPDCRQYWETYAKFGLWNDRTLMAHCVWSDARERQAMRDAGVTAVHCADSNQNICSGVAPVRAMLNEGVKVALGSDIAGGDHLHMFDVVAASIRASKARRVLDNWETDFLTVPEGWYLATSAGAAYFAEQPGFAPGNHLHALVLADDDLPQPHPMTPQERLERAVYLRQGGAIRAVWSEGRKVFSAEG